MTPLTGWLASAFGIKRVFLISVAGFTAASVLCGLTESLAQIVLGFLKELGADRLVLSDLPLAGLKHFARRMTSRKAAALARIKDPHRTIEVACFLRLRLLHLSDASLTLADHQIAAQWRGAPRARGGSSGEPAAASPSAPR
jgi:hypothetical protein